jgi:ribonuclease III
VDITQPLFSKNIRTNRKKKSGSVLSRFFSLFEKKTDKRKKLAAALAYMTGFKPDNLKLYQLALRHTSAARERNHKGIRESNERLEYLGDAILGAVIAEFLFKKFPYKDEGFLTEIRSRIVNRESLNTLCHKIRLNELVEYDNRSYGISPGQSMYGDAMEALVGAVFLDKGFKSCKKFILRQLLPHFDLTEVVSVNSNYKSMLIEWSQRENKKLNFVIAEERGKRHNKEFTAQVLVNDEAFSTGIGMSKKKAEQAAAREACELLGLK